MINTHSRVDLFPVQIGDVHFEATCSVFRETDFVRGRAARHIDGVALAHAGDECSRVGPHAVSWINGGFKFTTLMCRE